MDQANILLPRWTGAAFASGATSVRAEFIRLVEGYGAIPAGSPAVGAADPLLAPADDILGRPRDAAPDLGSYERTAPPEPPPTTDPPPPTTEPPTPTTEPPTPTTDPPPTTTEPPPPTTEPPTPPATPTGLTVSDPGSGGTLGLSWSANLDEDLAGYHLYRSIDPFAPLPWPRVTGASVATTTYTDTGLTNGATYWYRVSAVDEAGLESAPSEPAAGTPTRAPVVRTYVPTAVTLTKGASSGDPLAAFASDDAVVYRVNAVKQGKKYLTEWYGSATSVVAGATRLTVAYDGSASAAVTQTLAVYRYSTSSWVTIDTRSVSVSDVPVSWSTTTPSLYVSSVGQVRFRVSTTAAAAHTVRADLLRWTLEY